MCVEGKREERGWKKRGRKWEGVWIVKCTLYYFWRTVNCHAVFSQRHGVCDTPPQRRNEDVCLEGVSKKSGVFSIPTFLPLSRYRRGFDLCSA